MAFLRNIKRTSTVVNKEIPDALAKLTIFPEAKIKAVVFGSLILIITAANRCKNITKVHLNIAY